MYTSYEPFMQVKSSVWIDVATKGDMDDIDFAELEKLFAAEEQEAKKNIGTYNVIRTM